VSRPLLELDSVWKSFPRWVGGRRTVHGILSGRMPALARGGTRRWVLKDVSLTLGRGSSVGLIGTNGAGKSTLLRLASGLGRPTRGRIEVGGELASVLSLGDTFDLELTGRENAVTAAIVSGIPPAQARARIPAVLEFAELEPFADAPVRTYSEGMKLRLAFGVVAQLEPDLLLLDEVIAVGDLRFQRKCLDRIREMRDAGTAVLFASHSLEQVEAECDEVLWLQAGGVRASGESAGVVADYRDAMRSETLDRTPPPGGDGAAEAEGLELRRNRFGTQDLTIERVELTGRDGVGVTEIRPGESVTAAVEIRSHIGPVDDPIVGLAIHRVADGVICCEASTERDGLRVGRVTDALRVELSLERLDLAPGEYVVDVGVYEAGWAYAYDFHWQAYPLAISGPVGGSGVFEPPRRWQVSR
jgi:lipopolysaccharide transport system ATP-binding protein